MTRHDPLVRVRHMLNHAQEAVDMVRHRSRTDLDTDRQLNLSLVRLMEVVGEAASRVPDDFRERCPQIPWQDIADLRNRLIHGYDIINLDILWTIIQKDLPPLMEYLQAIVRKED